MILHKLVKNSALISTTKMLF